MNKKHVIALLILVYMGSAYLVREQSVKLGVDICERQTSRVDCACIGDVHRREYPLYSFWIQTLFDSKQKERERQQRMNLEARQCAR